MKNVIKMVLVMLALSSLLFVHLACGNWSTDYEDEEEKVPPPKPSIYAEAVSMTKIHLSLVAMGINVDGLKIERSKDDETNYSQIATVNDDVYDYYDEGLKAGTTYFYRARGYNKYGDSPYASDYASTVFDGYEMCVQKTTGFYCPQSRCPGNRVANGYDITSLGADVFDCLDIDLVQSSTMKVSFAYEASAGSCWNEPVFTVNTGLQTQTFSFDCNAKGRSSVEIPIAAGQTINDISFELEAGDWASWICIESITFTP